MPIAGRLPRRALWWIEAKMSSVDQEFELRQAVVADVPVLLELIRGLAEYERLMHLVAVTPEQLEEALFGARPAVEAMIAWTRSGNVDEAAGFALFFHNYSTFLGRRGLYLEDLFVRPAYRGRGCGKALLLALARLAHARNCGRFEWSVLDWNTPAQAFYQRLGATILPDWRIVRLTGDALSRLATGANDAIEQSNGASPGKQ